MVSKPMPGKDKWSSRKPLRLDLNEHSEGAPRWARQWIHALPEDEIWRYTDRKPLEAKLAAFFSLPPEKVLVTNGGDEAISYVFANLPAGTPVILPLPSFGFYEEQAAHWPVTPITLAPRTGLKLDWPSLNRTVTKHPGALVVLVRPNNPTGETVPLEKVVALMHRCQQHGTTLLVDEAYAEFAADNLTGYLKSPHLLVLRTFSKAYGLAGLRVGYLLGTAERLNPLRRRALPYNVSSYGLLFAERALDAEPLRETTQYCRAVSRNRDRLANWLAERGFYVYPSQANFLCIKLGRRRATFTYRALRGLGILVRDFKRPGLRDYLRISIPADDTPLCTALRKALCPDLICLDIDGCLVDVRESFDATVREIVKRFTGQRVSRADILRLRAKGGFNDDILLARELIKEQGGSVPSELSEAFRHLYLGNAATPGLHLRETSLARPGLLEKLRRRHALALVTGRDRLEAAPALKLLGIPSEVPCITVDDVARGKPDPEGILRAAAMAGAQSVWMVGDNPDDIHAARRAGAVPIGTGLENQTALAEAGAAVVLEDINQIETLLALPEAD